MDGGEQRLPKPISDSAVRRGAAVNPATFPRGTLV